MHTVSDATDWLTSSKDSYHTPLFNTCPLTLLHFHLLTYLLAWVSEPVLAGFLNAFALFLVKSQIKVFTHAPVLMPAVGVATLCFALIRALPLLSPGTNTPSLQTLSTHPLNWLIICVSHSRFIKQLPSSLLYLLSTHRLSLSFPSPIFSPSSPPLPPVFLSRFHCFCAAIPSSLFGLLIASLAAQGLGLPLATLASVGPKGTFAGGLQALPMFVGKLSQARAGYAISSAVLYVLVCSIARAHIVWYHHRTPLLSHIHSVPPKIRRINPLCHTTLTRLTKQHPTLSSPVTLGLPAVPLSFATLQIIVGTALGVTVISILETLMAARIAGGASKMQPNRLVVGLGERLCYLLLSAIVSYCLLLSSIVFYCLLLSFIVIMS